MAVPVHLLHAEASPLCGAPHQLLGTRDPGVVTCPDCLERMPRHEGQLAAKNIAMSLPKIAGRMKREGLAR